MQICQYRSLADGVQKLKGSDGTILKAYTFLRNMQFESNLCEILSYIDYIIGFLILISKSLQIVQIPWSTRFDGFG